MQPLFEDLSGNARLLILDFRDIPEGTPPVESIQNYFAEAAEQGLNPRLPENRQAFNDRLLDMTGMRYLVARYGEDRIAMLEGSSIAKEGRTIHLGIDVFSRECEMVYAPCDGRVVRVGREPEAHSFGYYLIFQPDDTSVPFIFLGHLSSQLPAEGEEITAGQPIARLGDFVNDENGGWSRHLHLQMLRALPSEGSAPIGYSTQMDFAEYQERFPDPTVYFPEFTAVVE